MEKKPVHHVTLKDFIAVRGDVPHDSNFYIFSRKNTSVNPELHYPTRSDFYTILLVTRGNIRLKLNLTDYTIEKNNVFFFFPNITFQFTGFSEDLLMYGIAFTPHFLTAAGISKKYINALGFLSSNHSPQLFIKQADAGMLCSSLDMLYSKSGADKQSPFRTEIIQHLFTAFLYELAAVYKSNSPGEDLKMTRKEEITVKFLQMLPQYYKEERSIKFYAEQLFVTPKYLSQMLKEATGKTAGYFIDEMVVLEAKVLLNNPNLSVAQVADELHFSDQFFFSKFFKRIAGSTPSDYRKRTT